MLNGLTSVSIDYTSVSPFTLQVDDIQPITFDRLGIMYAVDKDGICCLHKHGNYETVEKYYRSLYLQWFNNPCQ